MKLSTIFSVRNVLRASGCLTIILDAPMIIVPAAAICFYTGQKQDDKSDKDKKALNIITRSLGIVGTASGVKSIVAEASRVNLAAALYQESLFLLFYLCNRFTGEWKDAGFDLNRATCFIGGSVLTVAIQSCTLACSECEDEADAEKETGSK